MKYIVFALFLLSPLSLNASETPNTCSNPVSASMILILVFAESSTSSGMSQGKPSLPVKMPTFVAIIPE